MTKNDQKWPKLTKNDQNLTKNGKKWQNLAKICADYDPRVPMGQKLSISNQRQIAFTFAKKKGAKTTKNYCVFEELRV